jgi:CHAD domain-containing protein
MNATARSVLDYATAQRTAIHDTTGGVRDGDPDAVHDMRVAVRKLRSTLRTYRGFWPRERAEKVRSELKWLADRLGTVRDGQVMEATLRDALRAEPPELVIGPVAARLQRRIAAETLPARERLAETIDDVHFRALMADVDALLLREPERVKGRWITRRAGKALGKADRLMDRADRAADGDRDVGLHEARKAYKRGRYAVSAADSGKAAKRLAKRLGELQDVLGAQHDTVVLRALLREEGMRAFAEGENTFTYGLLHARQHERAERLRRRLPAVRKAAAKASSGTR